VAALLVAAGIAGVVDADAVLAAPSSPPPQADTKKAMAIETASIG
jgi:hypothetical protein